MKSGTQSNMRALHAELLELMKSKAYRKGRFRLASGGMSEYYLDAKQVTFLAQGVYLVARLFLHALEGRKFDAVGGPSIGADPIVGAMAALSHEGHFSRPVDTFIVRKQTKDHGVKTRLAGTPLKKGDRVIVIEDVVTRGGSALTAVAALKEQGCVVDTVMALVDRMEGGREKLQEAGCKLEALYTCRDFGHEPPA